MDMKQILMNMDTATASVGNKPFKGDPNFNDMKKILEGLEAVKAQDAPKQTLNEDVAVTMTGNTAPEVAELMGLLQNAGVKPVGADMPLQTSNPGKFKSAVQDDPAIPGRDDVPGDQDLKAGAIGSLAGGLAGGAAGQVLGKGVGAALGGLGRVAGTAIGGPVGGEIGSMIGKGVPALAGSMVGSKIGDKLTGEEYDNAPDEEYAPYSDMTNPPTNDLNKAKKSYDKAAGGDNPMALKAKIKEQLISALHKKMAS